MPGDTWGADRAQARRKKKAQIKEKLRPENPRLTTPTSERTTPKGRDTRKAEPGGYFPADYGQSLTPPRSTPKQVHSYERAHPVDPMVTLLKMTGVPDVIYDLAHPKQAAAERFGSAGAFTHPSKYLETHPGANQGVAFGPMGRPHFGMEEPNVGGIKPPPAGLSPLDKLKQALNPAAIAGDIKTPSPAEIARREREALTPEELKVLHHHRHAEFWANEALKHEKISKGNVANEMPRGEAGAAPKRAAVDSWMRMANARMNSAQHAVSAAKILIPKLTPELMAKLPEHDRKMIEIYKRGLERDIKENAGGDYPSLNYFGQGNAGPLGFASAPNPDLGVRSIQGIFNVLRGNAYHEPLPRPFATEAERQGFLEQGVVKGAEASKLEQAAAELANPLPDVTRKVPKNQAELEAYLRSLQGNADLSNMVNRRPGEKMPDVVQRPPGEVATKPSQILRDLEMRDAREALSREGVPLSAFEHPPPVEEFMEAGHLSDIVQRAMKDHDVSAEEALDAVQNSLNHRWHAGRQLGLQKQNVPRREVPFHVDPLGRPGPRDVPTGGKLPPGLEREIKSGFAEKGSGYTVKIHRHDAPGVEGGEFGPTPLSAKYRGHLRKEIEQWPDRPSKKPRGDRETWDIREMTRYESARQMAREVVNESEFSKSNVIVVRTPKGKLSALASFTEHKPMGSGAQIPGHISVEYAAANPHTPGAGLKVFREALKMAKDKGYSIGWGDTHNSAPLYKKLGFEGVDAFGPDFGGGGYRSPKNYMLTPEQVTSYWNRLERSRIQQRLKQKGKRTIPQEGSYPPGVMKRWENPNLPG